MVADFFDLLKAFVDFLLSLTDLGQSSVNVFHDTKETGSHIVFKSWALAVELLQFAWCCHWSDLVICWVEAESVTKSKIKVDFSVLSQEIVADVFLEEVADLVLSVLFVIQG